MHDRRRGDRRHRLLSIFGLLVGSYFGLFVWPTPWRHDRVGRNPVRTNRVTGEVEILNLQGWQPALPFFDARRRARPLGSRGNRPCETPLRGEIRSTEPNPIPVRPAT